MPGLAALRVVRTYAGLRPFSANLPLLGSVPGLAGLFVASGPRRRHLYWRRPALLITIPDDKQRSLPDPTSIRRGSRLRRRERQLRFDGRAIPFEDGDTIASALLRAGSSVPAVRSAMRRAGSTAAIGLCFECELVVDGAPAAPAMSPPVRDRREGAMAELAHFDVAIVGGGPAGLAAAAEAGAGGLTVAVVDESAAPGGRYFGPLTGARGRPARVRAWRCWRRAARRCDLLRGDRGLERGQDEAGFRLSLTGPVRRRRSKRRR